MLLSGALVLLVVSLALGARFGRRLPAALQTAAEDVLALYRGGRAPSQPEALEPDRPRRSDSEPALQVAKTQAVLAQARDEVAHPSLIEALDALEEAADDYAQALGRAEDEDLLLLNERLAGIRALARSCRQAAGSGEALDLGGPTPSGSLPRLGRARRRAA